MRESFASRILSGFGDCHDMTFVNTRILCLKLTCFLSFFLFSSFPYLPSGTLESGSSGVSSDSFFLSN